MFNLSSATNNRATKVALLLSVLFIAIPIAVNGQSYQAGQHIEPAFEGWRPNPDGTFNFMFGYMNENWQ